MLDAQYRTDGTTLLERFVFGINYAFTAIFALELCVNIFANWPQKFVRSGWNWLDLFVVVMSIVDFGPFDIPNWLVRLMRAFRIVRLFGRVQELTKMFSAITASLFPMMNAFVILIIVLSICEHLFNSLLVHFASILCISRADAILGVSLFGDIAPDQFGKFNRAFVTLFKIAAGDTWIDALPTLGPDGNLEWKPALFVCSFIVLSVWIVLQVSVAVLLDNFVTVSMRMENEDKQKASREKKAASQFQNPLEPLIAKLANEYTDSASLSAKLLSLFQALPLRGNTMFVWLIQRCSCVACFPSLWKVPVPWIDTDTCLIHVDEIWPYMVVYDVCDAGYMSHFVAVKTAALRLLLCGRCWTATGRAG